MDAGKGKSAISSVPKPSPIGWFERVSAATSFYAAFRPLFRQVGRWCTGIPCGTRRIATAVTKSGRVSLQLRVLGFCLLQDGDVGISVFPEGEEVLVGGERPVAGDIGIRALRSSRLQGVVGCGEAYRMGRVPRLLKRRKLCMEWNHF